MQLFFLHFLCTKHFNPFSSSSPVHPPRCAMHVPQTPAVWQWQEEYIPSLTRKGLKDILFALHTPTEDQYAKYERYTLSELSEAIHDLIQLNQSVHDGKYTWTNEDIQHTQAIEKALQKFLHSSNS